MNWKTEPLRSCTIDVTENCNMACSYCFTWGRTKRKLKLGMGKRQIDFFLDHIVYDKRYNELSFWGGEPLLEFNLIKKLILYTERKSSRIVFGGTTNGLPLNEDRLKFLRDHRAKFMISLDGLKETHDSYRVYPNGKGTWDDIVKLIPTILKVWPDARFRMSLTKILAPRLFEAAQWFYKEGIKWVAFSPVFEEDWKKKDLKILEKQLVLLSEFMNAHPDFFCKHLSDPGSGIWQNYPCGAARSYIGFSIDGDIYPCHRFNKYGNSKKNVEAREKWRIGNIEKGFNKTRQIFLDFPKKREEQCGECSIYKFCAGSCYAVTADLTGSIFGMVDKVCEYQKLIYEVGTKFVKQRTTPSRSGVSCICYNMCYREGSEEEIFYRDRKSRESCICYNTNYQGPMDPPDTRRII